MTSAAPGAPHAATAETGGTLHVTTADAVRADAVRIGARRTSPSGQPHRHPVLGGAHKIRHDQTGLCTRAIQPALWLLIFGETFIRIKAIKIPGNISYLDYLAPGILAQSALSSPSSMASRSSGSDMTPQAHSARPLNLRRAHQRPTEGCHA